jgi:hypothetical protein
VGRGAHWKPSSMPRSNGSTGSTTARLLAPIGHVPPAEAEAAYYRELEEPTPIAA